MVSRIMIPSVKNILQERWRIIAFSGSTIMSSIKKVVGLISIVHTLSNSIKYKHCETSHGIISHKTFQANKGWF